MAETPEIPFVPAEIPAAETDTPRPEPSEASLGGAEDAAVNNAVNDTETSFVASVSPAVVGSYGTPAPSASPEAPAPAEAAPAVFVAGYGSADADLLPEPPSPEAAAPVFVAGYGSTPPDSAPAGDGAAVTVASSWAELPVLDQPAANPAVEPAATPAAPIEAPSQQPEPPGIATSVLVPALSAAEAGEGGEWDLLRGKLRAWFDNADLQGRWEGLGGPLRASGLLLAAVVLLRLYSALLETLGDLPLLPRLLQLVGLVSVVQFALTRLVRTSERERILTSWRERWNDFRGRD